MNIINNFKELLENGKIRSAWKILKIFILYQTSDRNNIIKIIEECNQIFDNFTLQFFIANPKINISEDKLKKIPNLSIENQEGFTDYIDFIKWDDITSPVMKGIDVFNRPFFTMKLCLIIIDPGNNLITKYFPQTFFQRYTYDNNKWMSSGMQGLIFSCGGMNCHQFKMMEDLIDGKTVEIFEHHGINVHENNKNFLILHQKWEERAARIIQKNWRLFKNKVL